MNTLRALTHYPLLFGALTVAMTGGMSTVIALIG